MTRNLLVLAVAAASAMTAPTGLALSSDRVLANRPPNARTHVRHWDDSGPNGRLWLTRPLVNGGPEASDCGNPGAEAYGAWGEEDQRVYAQIGQTVVGISPWQTYTLGGLRMFEQARLQWLSEHGYSGGVRTFRRTGYEEVRVVRISSALPQPRATIQVPEGRRTKQGFHVDSGRRESEAAARLAALKTGNEPVRISWPMNAPQSSRAISDAAGGYLLRGGADRGTAIAQREP